MKPIDSAGVMTVGNGAVMAPSGTIHHTGSAALNAADDRAELQLAKHGIALEDGGWIGPSHSDWKINSGTSSIVTLNNEDHGALKNAGSINAADTHVHTSTAHMVFGSGLPVRSGLETHSTSRTTFPF